MKLYSIDEVCVLFGIDAVTLWRWRRDLGMVVQVDPANRLRRIFTDEQVLALAEAHHRVAVVSELRREKIERLDRQVADLDRRLGQVERLLDLLHVE
jgi:predicted site-specific integrase-resolvase